MTQILLLGDDNVGKTSLINKLIDIYHPTFQFTNYTGQLSHISELTNIIKQVKVILLVFDMTNKSSFDSIEIWYNLIKNIMNHNISKYIFYLVSTKNDLPDKIDYTLIDDYLLFKKILYYPVSIYDNSSIVKLMKSIRHQLDTTKHRCDCCTI